MIKGYAAGAAASASISRMVAQKIAKEFRADTVRMPYAFH